MDCPHRYSKVQEITYGDSPDFIYFREVCKQCGKVLREWYRQKTEEEKKLDKNEQ